MEKNWKKGVGAILMMVMAGIALVGCKEKDGGIVSGEISPILDSDGADPFVTTDGDRYLYTKTTGGTVELAAAESIQTLGGAERKIVYEPGTELTDLWAPEIWQLDGCWYIYFAAAVPGEKIHRMYVLSNPAEDPMTGTWECQEMEGMDDTFAIDGTILETDEKRYFLWSGWEGDENVRQDIYLAEMKNPTEVLKEKILLSKPEYEWETVGDPLVNEGPEILIRGETVNLVYSASGSWTDAYCLGLLTMHLGEDPKNPENWKKRETPILSGTDTVYGPGHNSFVTTTDGADELVIYHAARWQGAGWTRNVRYGYVKFGDNGILEEIVPVSGKDTLRIPSGDPEVTVYDYRNFEIHGEIERLDDEKCAAGFEYIEDSVSVRIASREDQQVCLVVFARADEQMEGSVAGVMLETGEDTMIRDLGGGEDFQPLYYPVFLRKGTQTIRLHSDMGGSRICISKLEIRK